MTFLEPYPILLMADNCNNFSALVLKGDSKGLIWRIETSVPPPLLAIEELSTHDADLREHKDMLNIAP